MSYGRRRPRYGFGGFRPSQSGATTSSKPTIYWDNGRNRYVIKTPFTEAFKNKILVHCPSAVYLGKTEAAFSINDDDLAKAKIVVEAMFGEFDFIEKPTEQFKLNGSVANEAALKMITVGGPDSAKKVYLMLVKQFHPDTSSTPDHDKTAAITTAWNQLKRELGWS